MSLALLFNLNNLDSGAPDVTAPEVVSAVIDATGTTLTIGFAEPVTVNTSTGFTTNLTGGAAILAYSTGSGSASLAYLISRVVYSNETGDLDYTATADGIEDGAGNDLEGFVGFTITNNSAVASPTGDLEAGAIVFTPPARSARNSGPVYVLQTRPGDVTKIAIDWSTFCAGEDADVESVEWSVESGDMELGIPTTTDNQSIILLTTETVERRGQIEATATLSDGQRDVVCIFVRCRSFR